MSEVSEIKMPAEGLVSAKLITEFLDISPSMWNKLQKNGKIKAPVKIGASSRWPVDYIRNIAKNGLPA